MMIKRIAVLMMTVGLCASIACGGIIASGDVDPADPATWEDTTEGYIGETGSGDLTVDDDSDLLSRYGYLGKEAGSVGTVTVSGAGSTWNNKSYLYIGQQGQGVLDILDGGVVHSGGVDIGSLAGSVGDVTVSGAGSTLTASSLDVGYAGSGTLHIADGGLVDVAGSTVAVVVPGSLGTISFDNGTLTTGGFAGYPIGVGTIHTGGLAADVDLVFDSPDDLTQTLTLNGAGQNITVNLDVSSRKLMGAGYKGRGSTRISNGMDLQTGDILLGHQYGSEGVMTVSGAGSSLDAYFLWVGPIGSGVLDITDGAVLESDNCDIGSYGVGEMTVSGPGSFWNNSGYLSVGRYGAGSLEISNGASVNTMSADIGIEDDSVGVVSVTGAGSTWTITDDLCVGLYGSGVLNIADDGLVEVTEDTFVGSYSGSASVINLDNGTLTTGGFVGSAIGVGTINAVGLVTDVDLVFDSPDDLVQTVMMNGPGQNITVNLNADGSAPMGAGGGGSGSMLISDGMTVQSATGYVGYQSGSHGEVRVTNGSTWTTNSRHMNIGYDGHGTLDVARGGAVSCYIGNIGVNSGSTGIVTLTGTGTTWTNSNYLYVGFLGDGVLNISDGASVSVGKYDTKIGSRVGSSGVVNVSGVGSTLTNSRDLYVGLDGAGELNISDGAMVSVSGCTYTAWGPESTGAVHFSNGTLNTGGFVGNPSGIGVMNTTGLITDVDLVFDASHGLTQTLTLSGPDQNITVNLNIDGSASTGAGYSGSGSMTIAGGVVLPSSNGYVGYKSGSVGLVTVSGAGSTWTISNDLYVGYYGSGTLNIIDGAAISTDMGSLGENPDSSGVMTVSGAGSTWTNSDDLHVGYDGSGMLNITSGAVAVNDRYVYIGSKTDSTGVATVSGAGSIWTNKYSLYIGNYGDGTLNITDGGEVGNSSGFIGNQRDSIGEVNVSGAGSIWANSDDLRIGFEGDGALNISNGGLVTVGDDTYIANLPGARGALNFDNGTLTTDVLWVSAKNLSGTGVINVNGLVGDLELVFDAAHGMMQSFAVNGPGQDITVNLNADGSGILGVGYEGVGSMRIPEGLSVQSREGYVGYLSGSSGAVTISGAGSTWGSRYFHIGHAGAGRMDVTDGGAVVSYYGAYIGCRAGSIGIARVSGAGSTWADSNDLFVGYYGSGTLNITDGAAISIDSLSLGENPGSSGVMTVSGAGSTSTNSDDVFIGRSGSGTLNITSGAVAVNDRDVYIGSQAGSTGVVTVSGVGSTWTNSGDLIVGNEGDAVLNISNGASVGCADSYIGYKSGSYGMVTVSGSGSTWSPSHLFVGYEGRGALNIADGGLVEASGDTHIEWDSESVGNIHFDNGTLTTGVFWGDVSNLSGTGRLNVKGFVGDVDLVFDADDLTDTVTLDGPGRNITMNLDLTADNPLWIGYHVSGSLHISNGLNAQSTYGYIGYQSDSTGVGTVSGSGSTWTNSEDLYAGLHGTGTLNIIDGAVVSNTKGYIGDKPGSLGAVTVKGLGSTWTNSKELFVGSYGSGTLNILDGAVVRNTSGYIGGEPGSLGVVTVSGPDSTWTNSGRLYVGNYGSGTLNITNGGSVVSENSWTIAMNSHSAGSVTVSGAGSTWTSHNSLHVGYNGNGVLNITNGAVVMSDDYGKIATASGSTGLVRVSGAGSIWNHSGRLYVGNEGDGALDITQGGRVINGSYAYLGYSSNSSGVVTVDGADSTWIPSIPSYLDYYVGYYGDGVLHITNGGSVVSDSSCTISEYSGSTSAVTVTGAGSTWTNSGYLDVGYYGDGRLDITDGGIVSNRYAYIARRFNSIGMVTVSGVGSTWSNSSYLYVGPSGQGTLNIYDGGLVSVGDELTIDSNGGNDSFVNMGEGGMLALYGIAEDSLGDFLDLINGTDAIRYWDESSWGWVDITSAARDVDYTLDYVELAGDALDGYTVLTVTAPLPIPGDSNHDYIIDDADYANLLGQFGDAPGDESADFNGDGRVDLADFCILRTYFGSGVAAPSSATESLTVTPEPASLILLAGGLQFLMRCKRRFQAVR
jgi:T5SS/PEP-CTERM-associated repeat protein